MTRRKKHGPITEDEALAALQRAVQTNNETRIARAAAKIGKESGELTDDELEAIPLNEMPESLDPSAKEMFSLRIPQTLLAATRAKVEMEGNTTITNVLVEALTAYVESDLHSKFTMTTQKTN